MSIFALSIDFGGLHHRGKKTFAVEFTGLIMFVTYCILFSYDLEILEPVWENSIVKIGTEYKAMDTLDDMSISKFKDITNLTINFQTFGGTTLSCNDLVTSINPRGQDNSVGLICLDENDGAGKIVDFILPESDGLINVFQGHGEDPSEFTIEIGCVSQFTPICNWNDHIIVTAIFNRQVPSSAHGTEVVIDSVGHMFDDPELFELNIHLQKINTIDHKSNEIVSNVTIDSHTDFNIASWGTEDTLRTTLGRVWIYVDAVQIDVDVYRVQWP